MGNCTSALGYVQTKCMNVLLRYSPSISRSHVRSTLVTSPSSLVCGLSSFVVLSSFREAGYRSRKSPGLGNGGDSTRCNPIKRPRLQQHQRCRGTILEVPTLPSHLVHRTYQFTHSNVFFFLYAETRRGQSPARDCQC